MRFVPLLLLLSLLSACGDSRSWLEQHPDSLVKDGQLICIIGDPGTGDENQRAVARALQAMDCDQIRVVGDVIYPSGITSPQDPMLQSNFMQPYAELLGKGIPFYLVMGNHDHKQNAGAWLQVAAENPDIVFPNWHYAERWGDICIFSLETTWYNKLYFIHKRFAETMWLRRAMEAQKDRCGFSLVLGHHPLMSSGRHGDAGYGEALFLRDEVFGKVDLYIAGHDHYLSDEGDYKGTRQLVSGAAGKLSHLKGDEQEDEDYHIYGAEGAVFAAWEQGFVTLRFLRDKDSGNVMGDYRFYAVTPDGEGGYKELRQVWEGQVRGRGLRLGDG
ncbi:metallophosphoesterase [Microbulbifer sp.]|uniref:metallophosphoesterase n=1 Tax=Microbulbifer sp. TaxID=1908541 RepID=UPI003F33B755